MYSKILEVVLILILNGFNTLQGLYKKKSRQGKIFDKIIITLSVISIIEIMISFLISDNYPFTWISTLCRVLFLFILVKQIRKTFARFMFVMVDSISMITFILFYVLFFALLGKRIFEGSVEGV